MKKISDIRLYKSDVPNKDGNSLPWHLDNRKASLMAHRTAMKLREQGFSLGDFDHLYLNFTPCLMAGTSAPAERKTNERSWYRYYDVGVDQGLFCRLEEEETAVFLSAALTEVLITFFAPGEALAAMVQKAAEEAAVKGAEMLMRFKVKKGTKAQATLFLRYLDNGSYWPLLTVTDLEGRELLRQNLPGTRDLSSLGEIRLSSRRVTVNPRKNTFAKELKPISFSF